MGIIKYIDRIERLDKLIRLRATGKPKDLAKRMDLSESVIYETIMIMKEYGAPIYYNRCIESYCYEEPCKFEFVFKKLQ